MIWGMISWLWRNHRLGRGVLGVGRAVDRVDAIDPACHRSITGSLATLHAKRRTATKSPTHLRTKIQLSNELQLLDTHRFL